MGSNKKSVLGWGVLVASVLLLSVGCAGDRRPTAQMATAETAVERARVSTAATHAPLELRIAEDKLQQARTAADREEYERAARLAEEARVDARLAEERAQTERSKQLAREMQESVRVLQKEILSAPAQR